MGKQKTRWIVTPGLLHEMKKFENLYRLVKREEREKDHRIPVMICGPTGVGKSLFLHIFQQLYAKENNSGGEVVRINCASFSEELLLSEIFGHIKGSFTGATRNRTGHIRKADKGVLILEEIGELSPLGQARLLTFIEDGYFFRVGSEKQEHADVQIVATTHRKREDFRDDFWNRFFPFYVSPIHSRRSDILYYLAFKFPDVIERLLPWEVLTLLAYNWPGNVREIERVGQLIRWMKEYQHDFSQEEEVPLLKGSLLMLDRGYTLLSGEKVLQLYEILQDSGVNVGYLESALNKFGLGLAIMKKKSPVFPRIHGLEYYKDEKIDNDFEVKSRYGTEAFDNTHHGFMFYCALFHQSEYSDKDLLDVQEGDRVIPILSPTRLIENPTPKHHRLVKETFEFFLGVKLPKNIKTIPHPGSLEYNDLMTSLEKRQSQGDKDHHQDILSMNEHEVLKMYYEGLLEHTGGNKTKAAEMAGLKKTTFSSRLRKYDIS